MIDHVVYETYHLRLSIELRFRFVTTLCVLPLFLSSLFIDLLLMEVVSRPFFFPGKIAEFMLSNLRFFRDRFRAPKEADTTTSAVNRYTPCAGCRIGQHYTYFHY